MTDLSDSEYSRQMTSKFNPNAVVFVPSKQTTTTQPSAVKSLKQNSNTSAHTSHSPSGAKGGYKNTSLKGAKSREPRGKKQTHGQLKNSAGGTQIAQHLHDELDLYLEDESGPLSLDSRVRKGQISINHLLNFSISSSEAELTARSKPVRRRRRSSHEDKIHLIGQEFVNANYRFVVDSRQDYNGQILDPNLVLETGAVLRVIVPRGNSCPICLNEDIVAPRIISCGHIFCHTCLLRYLDSEPIVKKGYKPKKHKECPFCSHSINVDDTKPVLITQTDERFEIPKVGEDVILKLMAKPHESILPIPFSLNLNHKKIGNIPWYSDTELYPYARIMKGDLKFIVDCFESDKDAITRQYEEDKLLYNDDGVYVEKALKEIEIRLSVLKNTYKNRYDESNPLLSSMDNMSINKPQSDLNDTNCYFFYQTAFNSTTRYFLSPLDVKILLNTYGSYSQFPTTLLLKVDNINYGQMVTENTLKKYKYISHLPLGTEFAFIDVNWMNVLPPDVYKSFAKVLGERRRKILSKLKREDRDKKSYEAQREKETFNFYKTNGYLTENDYKESGEYHDDEIPNGEFLHPLGDDELNDGDACETQEGAYETTVWGTKILKQESKVLQEEDTEEDWNAEEMIRLAKEEKSKNQKSKRKGKKKMVLLTSTSVRGH